MMEHDFTIDELKKHLTKLNILLSDYQRFNNVKSFQKDFSNNLSYDEAQYKNIENEYTINNLDTLVEICLIDSTSYLEYKIKDAIFFTKELIDIDKNAEIDYDKYTRLKFLYEHELKRVFKTITVYDDSTKEDIKYIINLNLENYISEFNYKEFNFIKEILEAFEKYHNEVFIANIIKRVSPNDPHFNSLKKAMLVTIEYANASKDSEYKEILEYRYNDIKNLTVTRANNKILNTFDKEITFLILSFFSDLTTTSIISEKKDDRGSTIETHIKTTFINPPLFKKAKKESTKLSNKIKDDLIMLLKDISPKYLYR